MIEPIDKKFFKALKSGDKKLIRSAFEEVYKAYVKLVAFVVAGYIDDREAIKDVVNDVFLNLFDHADAVTGSVKYYLTVSARNAAVNLVKREDYRKVVPLEQARENASSYIHNDVLFELKRHLSEEEVNIIVLHAIEGYTFKEIADMLGKNLNTVLSIYSRALKKYKKEAKGDE